MSTEFVQVQQKLYSQAAQILTAIKTTKVREAGERQWILSLAEEVVSYTRRKGFVRSRFLLRLQREFVYRGRDTDPPYRVGYGSKISNVAKGSDHPGPNLWQEPGGQQVPPTVSLEGSHCQRLQHPSKY